MKKESGPRRIITIKKMKELALDLSPELSKAIAHFWQTRKQQAEKQTLSGKKDQGARSAVTGGAQMDGFISLICDLIVKTGIDQRFIFFNTAIELPGFFRPTKEWDLLVVKNGQLILALEAKSQVGPSFGNNFNNRTEEAIGSAVDLWTAYREGAFNKTIRPWLGYIFLLEDCEASRIPVRVKEPHFSVFPEFANASYSKRYELFCQKLVRERHYNAAAFFISDRESGLKGRHHEPSEDITFKIFAKSLIAHASAFGD
jgi:hypothetical protein